MNKELLTVLGCSSSLAITLLASNSARANSAKEYVFKAPTNNGEQNNVIESASAEAEYPWYDCSCSEYNPEAIEKSDREGEKAISLYGCDCAGCRNLVRNFDENQNLIPQT
jgi:hypothetical protein